MGAPVLRLEEVPRPGGPGGCVEVAQSLNRMDLWVRRGRPAFKVSSVPARCDIAGVIESLGPG
jgi:NADPH:quinone reductase-like Zn-dependent oxidoreductase